MTGNEDEAMGILHMLNCGSNNAATVLEDEFANDTPRAVDTLYRIFQLNKEQARAELLKSGVKDPDKILQFTHCDPPQSFVIASDDMIGKGGVWAHFGSWNFTRAQIYVNTKNGSRKQAVDYVKSLGIKDDDATRLIDELKSQRDDRSINTWISPWPGYAGTTPCKLSGEIWKCQNGIEINTTDYSVNQANNGYAVKRVSYVQDGVFKSREFNKSINDIDAVLIPSDGADSTVVLAQYPLGTSMFTRLFYLKAVGLRHFDVFDDQTSVTGGRIITYEVDWSGQHVNYPYGGNPDEMNKTTNKIKAASPKINKTK